MAARRTVRSAANILEALNHAPAISLDGSSSESAFGGQSGRPARAPEMTLMTQLRHRSDVGKLILTLPFHGIDMPFAGNTFEVLIASITEA